MVCDSPGVPGRLPRAAAVTFFCFFLVDSLPLDSDRVGEPGRLSDLPFLAMSDSFCLPCGVVDPLALCSLALSLSLCASLESPSFFSSSFAASSSSSELSSSLYRFACKQRAGPAVARTKQKLTELLQGLVSESSLS